MGIPAYFSYIIKNHMKVLNPLYKMRHIKYNNLYMDCNSIIYDAVREIYKTDIDNSSSYPHILALVCSKIQAYIDQIQPITTIYIAFDGVAPLAKMEQQRKRRFLNDYLEKNGCAEISGGIPTYMITPGTDFMDFLSKYVYAYKFTSSSGAKIIISSCDQKGEGEHKLFQHIRNHREEHLGQNTIIYGLDADLLMLSIFHIEYTKLYVFRETPEFAKSLNIELENSAAYLLDIEQLCISINKEINMPITTESGATLITRIHDYAFLCFLLGNDFLPHIPVINIRIDGIQVLMGAYRQIMPVGKLVNIETQEINWVQFNKIIGWIEERKDEILSRHYKIRSKQNNRFNLGIMKERRELDRDVKCEIINEEYKRMLMWVLVYYTIECVEWRRRYGGGGVKKESYTVMCSKNYIMPLSYKREKYEEKKIKENSKNYKYEGEVDMSYRKYIWEAELKMEEMPLEKLEEMDNYFQTLDPNLGQDP